MALGVTPEKWILKKQPCSCEEHTPLHTAKGQAGALTNSVLPSHPDSATVHLRDFPYAWLLFYYL